MTPKKLFPKFYIKYSMTRVTIWY